MTFTRTYTGNITVTATELPNGEFDTEVVAGDIVKTMHFPRSYSDDTEQRKATSAIKSLVSALGSESRRYDSLRSELAPHIADIIRTEREMSGYPISEDEVARRAGQLTGIAAREA